MSNINENENGNTVGNGGFTPNNNDSNHENNNLNTEPARENIGNGVLSENAGVSPRDVNSDGTERQPTENIPVREPNYPQTENTAVPESFANASDSAAQSSFAQNVSTAPNSSDGNFGEGFRSEQHAESAGIRYNADKSSADGNYTWQYCNSGNVQNPMYHPPKKKHSALKAVLISVGCVAVLGVIGFSSWLFLRHMNFAPSMNQDKLPPHHNDGYFFNPDASKDKESGNKDLPIIGRTEKDGDNSKAPDIEVVPDENGILTKQMIAVKCKPSSVGIEVTMTAQSYFGAYKASGVGSGFILTEDGYIATNNHVIEGADEVTVMLDDGTKYPAKVIGADTVTDLAVVKIEATGLIPMEIGDSDLMQVGDSVIAIGTPAGIEFAGTVTDGIVSAINREVEVSAGNGYTKKMTLMQTNAAINPGNSGGPLINNKGEVVGINTLKLNEKYEGIGFSIPINSAVSIINQLIGEGHVTNYDKSFVTGNGSIGISAADVTEEESKFYNIPVGVLVRYVKPGSSASAAGLRGGDIITAFNGVKTATVAELNALKADYKAGDEVTLTVYRDPNEYVDITFKLDVMG